MKCPDCGCSGTWKGEVCGACSNLPGIGPRPSDEELLAGLERDEYGCLIFRPYVTIEPYALEWDPAHFETYARETALHLASSEMLIQIKRVYRLLNAS